MKNNHVLLAGMILFVLFILFTGLFSKTNYERKENYILVQQKMNLNKGEYFIYGKDPYVYDSPLIKISVEEEDWNKIQENQIYYIKYKRYGNKDYELISYQLKQ